MPNRKNIVVVKKLTKSYDGNKAVNGISFEVKAGEIFGILGPNGAGKTTTLEMIEAMRPIDSGTAYINGLDVSKKPYEIRRIIGAQPQSSAFQDKTKLKEIIELFSAAYGEKADPIGLLKIVQLEEKADEYAENLSAGQRQRLSIAAALVHRPKVFFMDEPTTGLDSFTATSVVETLKELTLSGRTVISTIHQPNSDIFGKFDRLMLLALGKVLYFNEARLAVDYFSGIGFKCP